MACARAGYDPAVRIILDREAADPAEVGGKGARLASLARQGLPVPRWLAVPVEVGDALLERLRPQVDAALEGLDEAPPSRATFEAAAARIAAALRAAGLPPGGAEALDAAVRAHLGGAARLAVRSSALGEDGERDSFAGQLDSFLGVAPGEVAARVLDVLVSAHGARALLYRRLRGWPVAGARAAVLVQTMVEADRAGVLFTANPATGDRGEAVIAAGRGTGEGVVAGTADAEVIQAELATGAERGRGGPGPVLSAAEVAALVALGRRVAGEAGAPQDLEWALDRDGALHLLQARPITAFAAGRETIFDSANIVESYPGVTRPLTFSFVRPAYERTLREASRRFGVGEATLASERSVHANLVALVDGRIHYAILNWYRLYRQLPGFAWTLPAFEKALGLPRRWVAPDPPLGGLARLARAATVGRAWLRLAGLLRRLDADAAAFGERLEAERARLPAGLDELDPHALLDELDRLSDQLTGPYAVALVNDFFTFQLHALVERLLLRFGAADAASAPSLRDALLIGIQGVESLEPLRSVAGLARRAVALPPVRALLESPRSDAEVWDALGELPGQPGLQGAAGFRAACQVHLERHGDRTLEELKLETPSLSEAPGGLVAAVRVALAAGVDPDRLTSGDGVARAAAEAAVARALAGHPLREGLFQWAVGHWRRGVRRREALRLARARGFGLAKRCYRALGRHLARAGLLDDAGDLLWLTVEEVDGAVRGHAVTRDLRALAALRRREWAAYERRAPAPRTVTHGIATARQPEQAPLEPEGDAEVLRGTGCSPGLGRGPARVVLEPKDATVRPGEVLVAATTDPGWIFLMAGASALVAERGNPLSHTAIVGRELGLPTVVGVAGATRLLVTGEPLLVDGAAGTVRRGAAAAQGPGAAGQSARPTRA